MRLAVPESSLAELRRLVADTGSFKHSPDKPFTLASGRTSPYYFDMKRLMGSSRGLQLLSDIIYRNVAGAASVGCMATGAIPLATAVALLGARDDMLSFYVRKSPKKHGTGNLIDGMAASPCVMVEDVVTSGGSALNAVRAAQSEGVECTGIYCILFRGTAQDYDRIEQTVPLYHIFAREDFTEQEK